MVYIFAIAQASLISTPPLLPGPCQIPAIATKAPGVVDKLKIQCGNRDLSIEADKFNAAYNPKINRYLIIAIKDGLQKIYVVDPMKAEKLLPINQRSMNPNGNRSGALASGVLISLRSFTESGIVRIWHRGRP